MKHKGIAIVSFTVILIIAVGSLIYAFNNKAYKIGVEELRMSEIKYSAVKSELITQVSEYIDSISPESGLKAFVLVEKCEEENINIVFVLAQGELESHFGTVGLAAKTNSPWNVGAFDNKAHDDIPHYLKYKDPNDAISPYLKLLKKKYLVKTTEEGLLIKFVDKDGYRYASDSHYEERLKFKYDKIIEQTDIDSLQTCLHYWAIKANRFKMK